MKNLNDLKREAREEFKLAKTGVARGLGTFDELTYLDTLIDRVVGAVEEAVVPERIGLESIDADTPILEQSGWNKCQKEVAAAFKQFREGGKWACPECDTTYMGPGKCGNYECSQPQRVPV